MKFLHLILFLLLSCVSFSQDIIEFRSGAKVEVSIVSKSSDQIEFQFFQDSTETVSIVYKRDILRLVDEDGKVETFEDYYSPPKKVEKRSEHDDLQNNLAGYGELKIKRGFLGWYNKHLLDNRRISKNEFFSLLGENKKAISLYNKGKGIKAIGFVIGVPSGFFLGREIGGLIRYDSYSVNKKYLIGGGIIGVISIVLELYGGSKMNNSLKLYNIDKQHEMGFGFVENGFGLRLKF